MPDLQLSHLIYASSPTVAFEPGQVRELLEVARRANAQRDVTGLLVYTGDGFLQVLEGAHDTVATLFSSIAADPRHVDVVTIIHEPIAARAFAGWTMAFHQLEPVELRALAGMGDFFERGGSFGALEPGRARKLIEVFAAGRWRAQTGRASG